MKRYPQCNRVETDEALKFCRVDGTALIKVWQISAGGLILKSQGHFDSKEYRHQFGL